MLNLNSCIYLDNSATSRYKPRRVIRAVEKELKRSANAGRGSHKESLRAGLKIEECRDSIRDITFSGEVVFTKSCTEALNLAIFGLYKGGEIITSVYEHNSVLRPIERLKSKGAKVSYLSTKNDLITPLDLERKITKNTSLVVLQEMSNVTGTIQDIESLGSLLESYGIPFIVDCAQSLGHVKSSYDHVTALASPAHKGLHGMQGTGFLVFKKGVELTPLIYGGMGVDSASLSQKISAPEGYEAGTINVPGIVSLKEGIDFTYSHFNQIERKINRLSTTLLEGLKRIPSVRLYTTSPNGVISFNLGKMPSTEVADVLDQKYGICVRSGIHCAPLLHRKQGTLNQGAVRASIGYNNTERDIDTLLEAVSTIVNK